MKKAYHIQVRFSDIDALGHVNNARFLEYFELARVYFFNEVVGQQWDWSKHGLILAKNEVEYIQPVLLNDYVTVHLWCDRIGTKSFDMAYELKVGQGNDAVIKAKGKSVIVCIDYKTQQTIEVPQEWREKMGMKS